MATCSSVLTWRIPWTERGTWWAAAQRGTGRSDQHRHSEPLRQVVFKRGTDIYFQGHNGETDIKNRPVDMGGGEGKMYVEGNIENYNTICKIESKWGLDVWLRDLRQAPWQAGGWGGEGDRTEVWGGRGCTFGQLSLMYDRKPRYSVMQLSFS